MLLNTLKLWLISALRKKTQYSRAKAHVMDTIGYLFGLNFGAVSDPLGPLLTQQH